MPSIGSSWSSHLQRLLFANSRVLTVSTLLSHVFGSFEDLRADGRSELGTKGAGPFLQKLTVAWVRLKGELISTAVHKGLSKKEDSSNFPSSLLHNLYGDSENVLLGWNSTAQTSSSLRDSITHGLIPLFMFSTFI